MPRHTPNTIKEILEKAYTDYHRSHFLHTDPISLAYPYKSPQDQEVVALFAAVLAYGNVKIILSSTQKILTALGTSPADTLKSNKLNTDFSSFRHRFTTGVDILILCHWIGAALRTHGSLEAFFLDGDAASPSMQISDFVERFKAQKLPVHLKKLATLRASKLKYLLPKPSDGSACKRLNLYLRWMAREKDGIDLGLWTRVRPASLMLPVDTHLMKAIRYFGWSESEQATWKVVESATAALRTIHPEDPIRYDFSLCQLAMRGNHIGDYFREGS